MRASASPQVLPSLDELSICPVSQVMVHDFTDYNTNAFHEAGSDLSMGAREPGLEEEKKFAHCDYDSSE